MIKYIFKIYKHYPKGKFYGQFGLAHTYLDVINVGDVHGLGDTRLAMFLHKNQESPVKGKVCSIAIVYQNSFCMNPNDGSPYPLNNLCELSDTKKESTLLKSFAKKSTTFVKLNGENSPFSQQLYYFPPQNLPKVTTNYFHYAIVVKNSPACTTYSKKTSV